MSSFATTNNDPQSRTQRRLLFEGFNVQDAGNSSRRHHSAAMLTSTPDHRLHEKENEPLDLIPSTDPQPAEPCLLQLQNARQLLHSMSRTSVVSIHEPQSVVDAPPPRTELYTETNPELAYYKSSLESERNRRKQLETLIDVQQQRLSEAESELIQLRANDHKKTLCMQQLEQMIPNVVDEWKQKETDYKSKLNNLTQQIKQTEQANREKILIDKQQFDEQYHEKTLTIERLTKENERTKQDQENIQLKNKQNEQRLQQLTKDFDQAKQRWSTLESDLRTEIKTSETRINDLQSDVDKKQQEMEQILCDQHKSNSDHQLKVRQLENELDEQRRETNVLKMELELREAKYRAQTESLKIQLMREAEAKLTQRLEEQHVKHVQLEGELNELHRRKLSDFEEKHQQILYNEQQEHESRVQLLLNKLDQMKNETERIQSTSIAERQDLAKKLQDVFDTALFKGSIKGQFSSHESINSPPLSLHIKSQLTDTQIKGKNMEVLHSLPLTNHDQPTNMSAIRSLASRIDSLVDQTNRVANGFEMTSRLPSSSSQQDNASDWMESNSNRLLSSRPHSALQSPFFRSTPIDPIQEWYPQSVPQSSLPSTHRSHSADPSSSGLFSTYPSNNHHPQQQQQQHSSNSFSLDGNLNTSQYHHSAIPSYRSIPANFLDHQQEIQATISKDSIDKPQNDQTSATNESLSRYVKMLLERSPTQDGHVSNTHPLAKTNRSLHDIQQSIEHLNSAQRDSKAIVDDLVLHNDSHVITPRPHKPSHGGVKKKLDYDIHANNNNASKQSNSNELFERLSQPKTKVKKDKAKQQQQQQQQQQNPQQQTSTGGHGVWK